MIDVQTWGTTPAERQLAFPCDRWLPHPDEILFRAVAVDAPAPLLFRWLCQLRVAPYSYDWIDNLGRQSPRQLTPGLDALEPGQVFMGGFTLLEFERDRHLTLRAEPLGAALGTVAVTYLVVPSAAACRLVVKLLATYPRWQPLRLALRTILPPGDLIMMRKQLLTLKALAERDADGLQVRSVGSDGRRIQRGCRPGYSASRRTVSGENAGTHTATYSAPSGPGEL